MQPTRLPSSFDGAPIALRTRRAARQALDSAALDPRVSDLPVDLISHTLTLVEPAVQRSLVTHLVLETLERNEHLEYSANVAHALERGLRHTDLTTFLLTHNPKTARLLAEITTRLAVRTLAGFAEPPHNPIEHVMQRLIRGMLHTVSDDPGEQMARNLSLALTAFARRERDGFWHATGRSYGVAEADGRFLDQDRMRLAKRLLEGFDIRHAAPAVAPAPLGLSHERRIIEMIQTVAAAASPAAGVALHAKLAQQLVRSPHAVGDARDFATRQVQILHDFIDAPEQPALSLIRENLASYGDDFRSELYPVQRELARYARTLRKRFHLNDCTKIELETLALICNRRDSRIHGAVPLFELPPFRASYDGLLRSCTVSERAKNAFAARVLHFQIEERTAGENHVEPPLFLEDAVALVRSRFCDEATAVHDKLPLLHAMLRYNTQFFAHRIIDFTTHEEACIARDFPAALLDRQVPIEDKIALVASFQGNAGYRVQHAERPLLTVDGALANALGQIVARAAAYTPLSLVRPNAMDFVPDFLEAATVIVEQFWSHVVDARYVPAPPVAQAALDATLQRFTNYHLPRRTVGAEYSANVQPLKFDNPLLFSRLIPALQLTIRPEFAEPLVDQMLDELEYLRMQAYGSSAPELKTVELTFHESQFREFLCGSGIPLTAVQRQRQAALLQP